MGIKVKFINGQNLDELKAGLAELGDTCKVRPPPMLRPARSLPQSTYFVGCAARMRRASAAVQVARRG